MICEPNARPSNASEPATIGSTPTRATPSPTPTPSAARVTASKGRYCSNSVIPQVTEFEPRPREGSSDRELGSSGPPDSLDGTVAHPPDTPTMITKGGLRCCWATSAALTPRATERAPIPPPTRSFEGKPARSGGAAAPDSEAGRSESASEDVRAARGRRRTAARTNSDAIAANRDLSRVSRPQETTPPTMRRAPPRPGRYRIPHDRPASSVHPHHSPHPVAPCPAPRCRTRGHLRCPPKRASLTRRPAQQPREGALLTIRF